MGSLDFIGYASSDREKIQNFVFDVSLSNRHKKCEIVQADAELRKELGRFLLKKLIMERDAKDFRIIKKECDSWTIIFDRHKIDCSFVGDVERLMGGTYDLKVFDDAQNISEDYFKHSILCCKKDVFECGTQDITPQVVLTMDPLKIKQSDWVYKFFEPWFSGKVPCGEKAFVFQDENNDTVLLDRGDPFIYKNKTKIYNFDIKDTYFCDIVFPQYRTLILE